MRKLGKKGKNEGTKYEKMKGEKKERGKNFLWKAYF
jgi:hypothetical protein